jgi:hypothetical protein
LDPATEGDICDLTSASKLLRNLPGVSHVEVAVPADDPTHRIVHLRDFHFVPKHLYEIENREGSYTEFLREFEAVQQEQMAPGRGSTRRTGLTRAKSNP